MSAVFGAADDPRDLGCGKRLPALVQAPRSAGYPSLAKIANSCVTLDLNQRVPLSRALPNLAFEFSRSALRLRQVDQSGFAGKFLA